MQTEARPEALPGLIAILNSSRSIAYKCQAVDVCLKANRCPSEHWQPAVPSCCTAAEPCLHLCRDNLHGFLEQCFAVLLKALFGYDGPSWLVTAAKVWCTPVLNQLALAHRRCGHDLLQRCTASLYAR